MPRRTAARRRPIPSVRRVDLSVANAPNATPGEAPLRQELHFARGRCRGADCRERNDERPIHVGVVLFSSDPRRAEVDVDPQGERCVAADSGRLVAMGRFLAFIRICENLCSRDDERRVPSGRDGDRKRGPCDLAPRGPSAASATAASGPRRHAEWIVRIMCSSFWRKFPMPGAGMRKPTRESPVGSSRRAQAATCFSSLPRTASDRSGMDPSRA